MTREEAIKSLVNTKVYVNGRSKEVQEKLFSLGFQWKSAGKQVLSTDMPFLFAWNNMNICYSNDMEYFVESNFKEITVNDILNIVIDKPKYRPFKDAGECWQEMLKHQPFGWIKDSSEYLNNIQFVSDRYITASSRDTVFSKALNEYVFADNTPFGIKEE